jgi:hypothetical protein
LFLARKFDKPFRLLKLLTSTCNANAVWGRANAKMVNGGMDAEIGRRYGASRRRIAAGRVRGYGSSGNGSTSVSI